MIKIEVTSATRKSINDKHREYIKQTSLQTLEVMISALSSGDTRYKFLTTLFGKTKNEREKAIIEYCLSSKLEEKIKLFNDAFVSTYGYKFSSSMKSHKEVIRDTRDDLDAILNYKGFNAGGKLKSGERWNRHRFITFLGIRVCPYCNRQYITSYEETGSKTTADADHYYIKTKYPILQMNIYNLIPSCNVCNSKTKGASTKKHLYPYKDRSNSLTFEIPSGLPGTVTKILIDTKGNPKAKNSVITFKLDKIYQAHCEEVSEVKERAEEYFKFGEGAYYAKSGLNVPFNTFNTWFSFMGKEMSAEPLIKLKQDIFNQLKGELEK